MPVLTSSQRRTLESAVKKARQIAERGAAAALKALAVHESQPYTHLQPDDRALRNSLRAKARLLGDKNLGNDGHEMVHIAYELAYEYWHSLLFASFLEANDLLMHTSGVAVNMEECEELAKEEGFADKWTAAASYASHMLPAIFRTEDPVMQVRLAAEDRLALEAILAGLERSIFTADDALGWVYQFWQSDAKERINKSGDKIDGEKLPAVTQLFTEPYMVHFLIDNTIGAWWAGKTKGKGTKESLQRQFPYLRLKENGSTAAGTFDGWPQTLAEVTCMDPCMGSGHFVSVLFSTLAPLRMAAEGLSKDAAADAVIAQNLHGLELDPRCTQIAAFNLALTAWKWCGRYRPLPPMNLACSGIAPVGKVEDWVKLVDKALPPSFRANLEKGMRNLYDLFQKAPELGSLLDPASVTVELDSAHFADLQPYLEKALGEISEEEAHERGVMAAGIAKAGALLARKYSLIITNAPYLGSQKYSHDLMEFGDKFYPNTKWDLALMLQERCERFLNNGVLALVAPQGWSYSTRFSSDRKRVLQKYCVSIIARLGSGAFATISGENVKVNLIVIQTKRPKEQAVSCLVDCFYSKSIIEKIEALISAPLLLPSQESLLKNPSSIVTFEEIDVSLKNLKNYAECYQGIVTGDINRFLRSWWEVKLPSSEWDYYLQAPEGYENYQASTSIIFWQGGKGELHQYAKLTRDKLHDMHESGKLSWNKMGVAIGRITKRCTIYTGSKYDNSVAVITPINSVDLLPILVYAQSGNLLSDLLNLDQKLSVTNATVLKVPFDLAHWQTVAAEKYPNGLPQPYSDDPTQWLFHGHPLRATSPLQVALARLAGYRWPAESDEEMELSSTARVQIEAIKEHDGHTDADGILCIPALAGEDALATRLRAYLQEVWGDAWSNDTIAATLATEGATARELEGWLRDEAFAQHCKVFGNRPFLWHIWDGRKDGFSAFVNYHKLDAATLQKLIFTYLGDYLRGCEAAKTRGESGADGKLTAARELKRKLEAILEGETPYDIFVRWKTIEQQAIGWQPDLNDGVRMNIRPFMQADVLRKKPNIKWGVDRGKNADGNERNNDQNKTLNKKIEARLSLLSNPSQLIAFNLHEGIYTAAEAAHITRFSVQQITTWFRELEAEKYEGINQRPGDEKRISFHGVIELKVIGTLRDAGVKLKKIMLARTALRNMIEAQEGVIKEYPLATVHIKGKIWASGNNVIWKFPDGSLMDLDGTKQLNFAFINLFFDDIHFNDTGDADYLLPKSGDERVTLNPRVGAGKPIIVGAEVPVAAIVANHRKGISNAQICKQLGVMEVDINGALKYVKEFPWTFT